MKIELMKNRMWFQMTHLWLAWASCILPSAFMGLWSVGYFILFSTALVICLIKSVFLCRDHLKNRIMIPSVSWAVLMWFCLLTLGVLFPIINSHPYPDSTAMVFVVNLSLDAIWNFFVSCVFLFLILVFWWLNS